jgi:uncharacterized membrane protein
MIHPSSSDTSNRITFSVLPKTLFFVSAVALFVAGLVMFFDKTYVPKRWRTISYLGPHVVMQILVSIVLLVATLFVILSKKYDAKDKHWAYTTIGLIIGFWLKP